MNNLFATEVKRLNSTTLYQSFIYVGSTDWTGRIGLIPVPNTLAVELVIASQPENFLLRVLHHADWAAFFICCSERGSDLRVSFFFRVYIKLWYDVACVQQILNKLLITLERILVQVIDGLVIFVCQQCLLHGTPM